MYFNEIRRNISALCSIPTKLMIFHDIIYFHEKSWFWLAETHLTNSISPAKSFHHTLTGDGTWQWSIFHDNGICLKNIDCTECVHVRFTIDSVWHHLSVWIEIIRNARSYLSFLNQTLYLINIQYNMIICPVQEGKTSYCNLQTNINYP